MDSSDLFDQNPKPLQPTHPIDRIAHSIPINMCERIKRKQGETV